MNRSVKAVGAIGVAILLLLGLKIAVGGQVDDQKLIKESLDEAVKAGREGKPGGVLEKLSLHLKVNGTEVDSSRTDMAKFIRNSRPDIQFDSTHAIVTGNEAKIVTPAHINVEFLGQRMDRNIKEVSLVFQKEDDTKWLVFPSHSWKLKEVTAPPEAIAAFMAGE